MEIKLEVEFGIPLACVRASHCSESQTRREEEAWTPRRGELATKISLSVRLGSWEAGAPAPFLECSRSTAHWDRRPRVKEGELHGLQEGHEGSEARPPGGPGRPPHQGTPRPSGGYSPSPPASCRHTSPSASCRFKQPSENRLLVSSHGESIVVRHSPLVRGRKRVGVGVEHAGGAVRKERWRRERWRKKALKEMRIEFARASSSGVVLYVESTS